MSFVVLVRNEPMNDNIQVTTDTECTIMSQQPIPDCPDCDYEYSCDWDRKNCKLRDIQQTLK